MSASPTETPISPLSTKPTAFQPAAPAPASAPLPSSINTSVQAINAQPVELDGLPTSPAEQTLKRQSTAGTTVPTGNSSSRVLSPADPDIDAEFLSEGGKSEGELGREVSARASL